MDPLGRDRSGGGVVAGPGAGAPVDDGHAPCQGASGLDRDGDRASFEQVRMFKNGIMLRVVGAAGIEEHVTTRVLPLLSLGSCGRQNVLAAVLDLDPVSESAGFRQTGIIGGNFLSQFRVVFDLSRSIVRLIPPSPPAMAGK